MAQITNKDLTTVNLEGSGIFDELMKTVQLRLDSEYAKNRIKGADYSKVYLGAMSATMQQSLAFLMGKQAADKQAELLAAQAATEAINTTIAAKKLLLVTEEVKIAEQAVTNLTTEALILAQKLLLITEEVTLAGKKTDKITEDENLVKEQVKIANQEVLTPAQVLLVKAATVAIKQEEAEIIVEKGLLLDEELLLKKEEVKMVTAKAVQYVVLDGTLDLELAKQASAIAVDGAQVTALGAQATKSGAESTLLGQKKTTEEAQTANMIDDTVVDGLLTASPGVVGKQKMLYQAQTQGFARDAEQKLLKQMTDYIGVSVSADSTFPRPTELANTEINKVINVAKAGVGIVVTP